MNRKLLCGLVLEAGGRGDRLPQRLRYLVEPIALAGNICHVLRLLFVDHSVPLIGMSPTRNHCELLTAIGASDWAETSAHYLQTPLVDFPAWSGWLGRCTIQFFQAGG